MKWWVDIANAPHATLFKPVTDRLCDDGHEIFVTAWDRGQARVLALEFWPGTEVVGAAGYRRRVISKASVLWDRSTALIEFVRAAKPDLALSHNSYSQILAARRLRIPSITMMDYEHQPANHLAFRLASLVVLPEALPDASVRLQGAAPRKVVRYSGYKEEVTLSRFTPDAEFRDRLELRPDEFVAVVRPAAEGALYHRRRNSLCDDVIDFLVSSGATVLLSPRTADQAERYRTRPGVRVLSVPVSGADLLYYADLVIGAGGTMTREAAVIGTPTWSIFQGKPAAVDRALARSGSLRFLTSVDRLRQDGLRRKDPPAWKQPSAALDQLIKILSERGAALVRS